MTPPLREPLILARPRRYRIVVGIDLSEYTEIVIEHALDQAARHDQPELHFLTVRETRKPSNEELKQALWERVAPELQTFNEHGRDWRARLHVRTGAPDEQIALLAAEIQADLIVIGQFGLHDNGVPNQVVHASACPTLVVGMPQDANLTPMCPMCVTVRDESDGNRWFCAAHVSDARGEHVMTPMTVWDRGALVYG